MAERRRAASLTLYTEHERAIFHGANIAADKQKSVPQGHNLLENVILCLAGTRMRIQSRFEVYEISMKHQRQGGRPKIARARIGAEAAIDWGAVSRGNQSRWGRADPESAEATNWDRAACQHSKATKLTAANDSKESRSSSKRKQMEPTDGSFDCNTVVAHRQRTNGNSTYRA